MEPRMTPKKGGSSHSKRYREGVDDEPEVVAYSPPVHRSRLEVKNRSPSYSRGGRQETDGTSQIQRLPMNSKEVSSFDNRENEASSSLVSVNNMFPTEEVPSLNGSVMASYIHRFRTAEPAPSHERTSPTSQHGNKTEFWWNNNKADTASSLSDSIDSNQSSASSDIRSQTPGSSPHKPSSLSILKDRMQGARSDESTAAASPKQFQQQSVLDMSRGKKKLTPQRKREDYFDSALEGSDESEEEYNEDGEGLNSSIDNDDDNEDGSLYEDDTNIDEHDLDMRASMLLKEADEILKKSSGSSRNSSSSQPLGANSKFTPEPNSIPSNVLVERRLDNNVLSKDVKSSTSSLILDGYGGDNHPLLCNDVQEHIEVVREGVEAISLEDISRYLPISHPNDHHPSINQIKQTSEYEELAEDSNDNDDEQSSTCQLIKDEERLQTIEREQEKNPKESNNQRINQPISPPPLTPPVRSSSPPSFSSSLSSMPRSLKLPSSPSSPCSTLQSSPPSLSPVLSSSSIPPYSLSPPYNSDSVKQDSPLFVPIASKGKGVSNDTKQTFDDTFKIGKDDKGMTRKHAPLLVVPDEDNYDDNSVEENDEDEDSLEKETESIVYSLIDMSIGNILWGSGEVASLPMFACHIAQLNSPSSDQTSPPMNKSPCHVRNTSKKFISLSIKDNDSMTCSDMKAEEDSDDKDEDRMGRDGEAKGMHKEDVKSLTGFLSPHRPAAASPSPPPPPSTLTPIRIDGSCSSAVLSSPPPAFSNDRNLKRDRSRDAIYALDADSDTASHSQSSFRKFNVTSSGLTTTTTTATVASNSSSSLDALNSSSSSGGKTCFESNVSKIGGQRFKVSDIPLPSPLKLSKQNKPDDEILMFGEDEDEEEALNNARNIASHIFQHDSRQDGLSSTLLSQPSSLLQGNAGSNTIRHPSSSSPMEPSLPFSSESSVIQSIGIKNEGREGGGGGGGSSGGEGDSGGLTHGAPSSASSTRSTKDEISKVSGTVPRCDGLTTPPEVNQRIIDQNRSSDEEADELQFRAQVLEKELERRRNLKK